MNFLRSVLLIPPIGLTSAEEQSYRVSRKECEFSRQPIVQSIVTYSSLELPHQRSLIQGQGNSLLPFVFSAYALAIVNIKILNRSP